MSMQIADNFSYQGTKPLDARIKYATVADMKAVAESSLYDGCMAYVTGVKKYYTYDSTNTVDSTTGKWREYKSGSGHTVEDASGTAMADQPNLQFKGLNVTNDTTNNATVVDGSGKAKSTAIAPVFDATETYAEGDRVMYGDELYVFNTAHTGAWDAADADKSDVDTEIPDVMTAADLQDVKDAFQIDARPDAFPILFDETGAEHFVGWYKLANGTKKPVYEKMIDCGTMPNKSNKSVEHHIENITSENIRQINGIFKTSTYATSFPKIDDQYISNQIQIEVNETYIKFYSRSGDSSSFSCYVIIQYTKTTDTPQ